MDGAICDWNIQAMVAGIKKFYGITCSAILTRDRDNRAAAKTCNK